MIIKAMFGTIEASEATLNWLSLALSEASKNIIRENTGLESVYNFKRYSDIIHNELEKTGYYDYQNGGYKS